MYCSASFRLIDFSGVRKKFLTSCCVSRAATDEILLLAAQVRDDRADRADDVNARVIVEAAILDREHGLHHPRRNRGERHLAPLLPAGADERGEERRVERDLVGAPLAGLEAADAYHLRRQRGLRRLLRRGPRQVERRADDHALLIAVARDERDGVAFQHELAGLLDPRSLGIPQVVQPIDQLPDAKRLAAIELERTRVDAGQDAIAFAVEPRVNLPREEDPVVAEDADDRDGADEKEDADDEPRAPGHADDEALEPAGRAPAARGCRGPRRHQPRR